MVFCNNIQTGKCYTRNDDYCTKWLGCEGKNTQKLLLYKPYLVGTPSNHWMKLQNPSCCRKKYDTTLEVKTCNNWIEIDCSRTNTIWPGREE